jgi:hypothetical protein
MTRFTQNASLVGLEIIEERLRRIEQQWQFFQNNTQPYLVQGRLNTTRTPPTSSADVKSSDKIYDIVRDASYEYILIVDTGTLAWRRITMSSF